MILYCDNKKTDHSWYNYYSRLYIQSSKSNALIPYIRHYLPFFYLKAYANVLWFLRTKNSELRTQLTKISKDKGHCIDRIGWGGWLARCAQWVSNGHCRYYNPGLPTNSYLATNHKNTNKPFNLRGFNVIFFNLFLTYSQRHP